MVYFEVFSMKGYITVQEAAEKWGVTPRQVQPLCKEGRIAGVSRMGRIWIVPKDAKKPAGNKRHNAGGKDDATKHHV